MGELVSPPNLDIRSEELIAAQALWRVVTTPTPAVIDHYIGALRELRKLAESESNAAPLCPELTNVNPSSPHTVLLEAMAWLIALLGRKVNLLPERDAVEFARLFKIELREAAEATASLRFVVSAPANTSVTVPAGTEVSTEDGSITFATVFDLVIVHPATSGDATARRDEPGVVVLAPHTLTRLDDPVAFVTAVTNPQAVESGSARETLLSALQRARNYQRRAERLVSGRDIEDAIREEAMGGTGVVRAFPLVPDGDFTRLQAGHTTVVVMTSQGNAVSDATKAAIRMLLDQAIGSQFIYLRDPSFVDFNVAATVRLTTLATQGVVLSRIEAALREFYAASEANFGRPVLRSEIIAIIEGTPGVDRIVPSVSGEILAAPLADVTVAPYRIPRLVSADISVVS
ncbi:MAG: baseplate J/gp47 family protein [Pyrinomonadaceae bacterium]